MGHAKAFKRNFLLIPQTLETSFCKILNTVQSFLEYTRFTYVPVIETGILIKIYATMRTMLDGQRRSSSARNWKASLITSSSSSKLLRSVVRRRRANFTSIFKSDNRVFFRSNFLFCYAKKLQLAVYVCRVWLESSKFCGTFRKFCRSFLKVFDF